MTAGERYGALTAKVKVLVAEKRRELDERHPQLRGALAELQRHEPYDPSGIVLGRDDRGRPVILPARARLESMHVIGATGSGKSNLLEHMIRQDILLGRGVCVVDPHGNHPDSLYRSVLLWLAEQGLDKRRIVHLIDPNAASHSVGFNPLDRGDADTAFSVVAEAMFEAFERMWGDEDGNTKPTIQRVLTATFTALGEQGLTLAEARLLFDPEDTYGVRALVLSKLQDSYAHDELDWLHRIGQEKTGRRDFRAEAIGPINRIAKLVRTEAVRAIVGQTENVIDLREAMDEGHIILCNLSGGPRVYEQGADLLGRLLIRFLFFHARRRINPERIFPVYLDECHRYLSGDVPSLLAEVRKYGIAICAGHQWLAQLGRRDDPIREALCKGPNIKIAFRLRDPAEAAELAEAVMPLNLELPVNALVKPTVVGHERTLFRNSSVAQHSGSSWAVGKTDTQSISTTKTRSVADTDGVSSSDTIAHSFAETEGESVADSISETHGGSVSVGQTDTYSADISESTGRSRTQTQSQGMLLSGPATDASYGSSEGSSSSRGRASSSSRVDTDIWSRTTGRTVSKSRSTTRGVSNAHTEGRSHAHTIGKSVGKTVGRSTGFTHTRGGSEGTSRSTGASEGIEPVYADLPTAVHSKENVLYMAAQQLRSLKTGVAYLSYVAGSGLITARIAVPKVRAVAADNAAFNALRDRILAQSRSAIPMSEAIAVLEKREQQLIAEAKQVNEMEEPASFRVALGKRGRS
jgi:hypothetical protein